MKKSGAAAPNNKSVSRKGSKTPPEVQATVIGILLSGQFATDTEVATAAGVSKSTVSRLKASIPPEYLKQAETLKNEKIGALVLEFLEEGMASGVRVNRVTLNEEWLFSQDAASLATLYGVTADKVIRILEAIEQANLKREAVGLGVEE